MIIILCRVALLYQVAIVVLDWWSDGRLSVPSLFSIVTTGLLGFIVIEARKLRDRERDWAMAGTGCEKVAAPLPGPSSLQE
jgi:hypothetical protein